MPSEMPSGPMQHRSGVVTLAGLPNSGKSTLLNHLLGQKIAIVTPKPQTTRNRILGIVTGEDHQIILLDTPGLHIPRDPLNREMVKIARQSLGEADLVLFIVDAAADATLSDKKLQYLYADFLSEITRPIILVLNKIDLRTKTDFLPLMARFQALHPFEAIIPISALQGDGIDTLLAETVKRLPEGPQYYPPDLPTDATERFIVAEMIRENIFLLARDEVPYATAVLIDAFQEGDEKQRTTIHATILVERASQKGIIIGRQGSLLKEIGRASRLEIEKLLDCPVTLKLWVKVKKKWSQNRQVLSELGF